MSSSRQKVVKRTTALLPIYSLMLGFLALLGYMAIAAKINPANSPLAAFGNNASFPSWRFSLLFSRDFPLKMR